MEKTYPVELKNYRRLGDESVSLSLATSVEVSSEDIKFFDDMRGNQCFLVITGVKIGLDMPDIDVEKLKKDMVENKIYDKNISFSQREMRDLWVICSKILNRKPKKEEFEEFYKKRMERKHQENLEEIASYEDDLNKLN